MSAQNADYERASERQDLASLQSRERIARIHLWLQGGPHWPTAEERQWVRDWFPGLHGLVEERAETGGIHPSNEYHLDRARRFIAGDLDALTDG